MKVSNDRLLRSVVLFLVLTGVSADAHEFRDPARDWEEALRFAPPILALPDLTKLEAAQPTEAVTLIEPPKASASGEAGIEYPIDLPGGRHNMAPSLRLIYNSNGGNGWLGVGWSLPVPAIEVDTRWGAPRYNPELETEAYLLSSQQLTPMSHRPPWAKRNPPEDPKKRFHLRREGQFLKILRYGTAPSNYRWEVTDKQGVRSFYGVTESEKTAETVLKGAQGIFKWPLVEIRDRNGNSVRFNYRTETRIPVGKELYLTSIDYVRDCVHVDDCKQEGYYSVHFEIEGRDDAIVDGRGGFVRWMDKRLKAITIKADGNEVRKYELAYSTGPFGKSLLKNVAVSGFDEDDEVAFAGNVHTFCYFNNLALGDSCNLDEKQEWALAGFGKSNNTSLSGGELSRGGGSSIGGQLHVGFNLPTPSKIPSFGFTASYQRSTNETKQLLLDLDGDRIPDLVEPGKYRPGSWNGKQILFGDTKKVPNLKTLGTETSQSFTWGGEAHAFVQVLNQVNKTWSRADSYLVDANSDGLVDLVRDGTIYFNECQGSDPSDSCNLSDKGSSGTPVPIEPSSIAHEGLLPDMDLNKDRERARELFPRVDTVRVWNAPWSGKVRVGGNIALQSTDSTGVQVAIERSASGAVDRIWSAALVPDDSKKVVSVETDVRTGDRLYFRLQPGEHGGHDQVKWVPTVIYLDGLGNPLEGEDSHGRPLYSFDSSKDFLLSGWPGAHFQAPFDGKVALEGKLRIGKVAAELHFVATANSSPIHEQLILAGSEVEIDLGMIEAFKRIEIAAEEPLHLAIHSDIDFDATAVKIEEPLTLRYLEAISANEEKTPIIGEDLAELVFDPGLDMDLYPARVVPSPAQPQPEPPWHTPTQPLDSYMAEADETGTLKMIGNLPAKAKGALTLASFQTEQPAETVSMTIENGQVVQCNGQDLNPAGALDACGLELELVTGTLYSFVLFTRDAEDLADGELGLLDALKTAEEFRAWRLQLQLPPKAPGQPARVSEEAWQLLGKEARSYLPQSYRGWSVVGYPANEDGITIAEENLTSPSQLDWPRTPADGEGLGSALAAFSFNPTSHSAVKRAELSTLRNKAGEQKKCDLPAVARWQGPDQCIFLGREIWGTSRLGPAEIRSMYSDDLAGSQAPPRVSNTRQTIKGKGFLFGSISTTDPSKGESSVDYFDLNGDGFPDVVKPGEAQISLPWGALAFKREKTGSADIRTSLGKSTFTGLGASPASIKAGVNGLMGNSTSSQGGAAVQHFSPSVGESNGDSATLSNLIDINGDGLPDRVRVDGKTLFVSLGLGRQFAKEFKWGSGVISHNQNGSKNYGLGYNDGTSGVGGGGSFGGNTSRIGDDGALRDVNGDGLPDRVKLDPQGKTWRVQFNLGAGFAPELEWSGALNQDFSASETWSKGAGGRSLITPGPFCFPAGVCYVTINPGSDASLTGSRSISSLIDINGDGYPDHVIVETDDRSGAISKNQLWNAFEKPPTKLSYALNQTRKTNLLKRVERPLGATIELDYDRTSNTFNDPMGRWVLSSSRLHDGLVGDDAIVMGYEYGDPYYDRFERRFLGFRRVVEKQMEPRSESDAEDSGTATRVYRRTLRCIDNRTVHDQGQPLWTAAVDPKRDVEGVFQALGCSQVTQADQPTCKVIVENFGTIPDSAEGGATGPEELNCADYVYRSYDNGIQGDEQDDDQKLAKHHPGPVFGYRKAEREAFSEGSGEQHLQIEREFEYDHRGNLVRFADNGDPAIDHDEFIARLTYTGAEGTRHAACAKQHQVGSPDSLLLTDGSGRVLRYREADYDCESETGNLLELREYLSEPTKLIGDLKTILDRRQDNDVENAKVVLQELEDLVRTRHNEPVEKPCTATNGARSEPEAGCRGLFGNREAEKRVASLRNYLSSTFSDSEEEEKQRAEDILRQLAGHVGGTQTAPTSFDYRHLGLLSQVLGPPNHNGERYGLHYNYDRTTDTYPIAMRDSFGYETRAAWDTRFGRQSKIIDPNGQEWSWQYDVHGRLAKLRGPRERTTDTATVTIDHGSLSPEREPDGTVTSIPWSRTRKRDCKLDCLTDPTKEKFLDEIVFADGFGRVVQRKRDAEVGGADACIISGHLKFDFTARVKAKHYPTYRNNLCREDPAVRWPTPVLASSEPAFAPPTRFEYDRLDRVTKTTYPDENLQTVNYQVGPRQQQFGGHNLAQEQRNGPLALRIVTTDPAGNTGAVERDIRSRVHSVRQDLKHADETITGIYTLYEHNQLGELEKITDAGSAEIKFKWDGLGRRTSADHPDTGETVWTFDLAGNRLAKTTANLRDEEEGPIRYDYLYNRLRSVRFPLNGENDIIYHYGPPLPRWQTDPDNSARANRYRQVGRIARIDRGDDTFRNAQADDAKESDRKAQLGELREDRWYDELGQLAGSRRWVAPGDERPLVAAESTFTTDTWGRPLRSSTSLGRTSGLDSSVVHYEEVGDEKQKTDGYKLVQQTRYDYGTGGKLNSITRPEDGQQDRALVRNIDYDQFEQRTDVMFGNDVVSTYTYEPKRRWLSKLETGKRLNRPVSRSEKHRLFQDYDYNFQEEGYDAAGNLLRLVTNTPGDEGTLGAIFDFSFEYDSLYRLITTEGKLTTRRPILDSWKNSRNSFFQAAYSYDEQSNLKTKCQRYEVQPDTAIWSFNRAPSQNFNYTYSTGSRQVSNVDSSSIPDRCGNIPNRASQHKEFVAIPATRDPVYDDNGNLTQRDRTTCYLWDEDDKLIGTGCKESDKERPAWRYVYSSDGRRLVNIDDKKDETVVYIDALTDLRIPHENDEPFRVSRHAFWHDQRVATITRPATFADARVDATLDDLPAEKIRYYHPDHLGSATYQTDEEGAVARFSLQLPFGQDWIDQERSTDDETELELFSPRAYKYIGKEFDEDTGLYNFGAREYDPVIAAWASADPALFGEGNQTADLYNPMDLAIYSYAHQNPVTKVDPDGEAALPHPFSGSVSAEAGGSRMRQRAEVDQILYTVEKAVGRVHVTDAYRRGSPAHQEKGAIDIRSLHLRSRTERLEYAKKISAALKDLSAPYEVVVEEVNWETNTQTNTTFSNGVEGRTRTGLPRKASGTHIHIESERPLE